MSDTPTSKGNMKTRADQIIEGYIARCDIEREAQRKLAEARRRLRALKKGKS